MNIEHHSKNEEYSSIFRKMLNLNIYHTNAYTINLFSILFVLSSLIINSNSAHSAATTHVCAEYENSSHKYYVPIEIIKGEELNERTNSIHFKSYDQYGAIFWGKSEVTLIDFEYSYCGDDLSYNHSCNGTDQEGRNWTVNFSPYTYTSPSSAGGSEEVCE